MLIVICSGAVPVLPLHRLSTISGTLLAAARVAGESVCDPGC